MLYVVYTPATHTQEDHEFESALGYILSLGPASATSQGYVSEESGVLLNTWNMNMWVIMTLMCITVHLKNLLTMADTNGWHLSPLRYRISNTCVKALAS